MENEVQKKRIFKRYPALRRSTLGSYLGAIKELGGPVADEYDCYYMLADMHTITVRQVPADLRRHTLTQLAAYIASGLDLGEKRAVCPVPCSRPRPAGVGAGLLHYVRRAQPHDPVQGQVRQERRQYQQSLFTYPALMADILLYQGGSGARGRRPEAACESAGTWPAFGSTLESTADLQIPAIFPKVGARIMSLTSPKAK